MAISLIGAVCVGLIGIAFVQDRGVKLNDPKHFYFNGPNFIPSIGWWFPSCFLAAIMSTISSQLLVTSSSLTEDFYKLIRGEEAAKT